jgi:hypothetical protein
MRAAALGLLCLACGQASAPAPTCAGDALPGTQCVDEVRGQVEGLDRAPLGGLGTSVCGRACYGATTDPSGAFRVKIGAFVDLSRHVVHIDGRPDHADVVTRLAAADSPTVALSPIRVPGLPSVGAPLPPDGAGGQVTAGPVTLKIPAGAAFTLAFADAVDGDRGRLVRASPVSLDDAPDFGRLAGAVAVYALAPAGAVASTKVALSVRNDAALPPGAAAVLLTLEDDSITAPLEAGTLRPAAAAHVSADGATIETDPGEGITKITWLGVRLK